MADLPAVPDLVAMLRTCRRNKDLERALCLLAHIRQRQLDTHPSVGNCLIPVLVECGSLRDAQHVFDRLPCRTESSWASLISGYIECGRVQHAFNLQHKMEQDQILPSSFTFVPLLKVCTQLELLDKGQALHASIIKKGLEEDKYIGNALVDLYGKSGLLLDAQEVFDKIPTRDAVSWNALITGYTEHGLDEEALACFKEMQVEGFSPDETTFLGSLRACGGMKDIKRGQLLYNEISKQGLEQDLFVGSTIVDMYAKCGLLVDAQEVFDRLPVRSIVSWTVLIAGYVQHGYGNEALSCFQKMQLEDIAPVTGTFTCSLKACGITGNLETGWEIHVEIVKRGLEGDMFVANTLVDMYTKCGSLAEGMEVYDKMPARNVVSWTAMVHGCGHDLACGMSIQPNTYTFVALLKSCIRLQDAERGQRLHSEIIKKGLESDHYVGNTLVDMYGNCSSLAEVKLVFDKLPVRNVVTWNTLVAIYADYGIGEDVLTWLKQMQLEKISPNDITFISTLKACATIGALKIGHAIHAEIAKLALELDLSVANMLIDMYCKCGSLVEGQKVFDKLAVRDIISWTAMIKGFGENDDVNMAIQCFESMQEQGLTPNDITFTCLLVACSRANLVSKGQEYFKVMRDEYKIEPTRDHYACMINLLSRSGHVHEAVKFSEAMQCLPSKEILQALLTACQSHGEIDLGLRCFQQLVLINQEDTPSYLLMAGIYANAGRLADANKIEEIGSRKNRLEVRQQSAFCMQ